MASTSQMNSAQILIATLMFEYVSLRNNMYGTFFFLNPEDGLKTRNILSKKNFFLMFFISPVKLHHLSIFNLIKHVWYIKIMFLIIINYI